jgi:hypothetical protein
LADWQQIVRKIVDTPSAKISEFAAVLQPEDSVYSLAARAEL